MAMKSKYRLTIKCKIAKIYDLIHNSKADIVLVGGVAGSGKSYSGLMSSFRNIASYSNLQVSMFRLQEQQLKQSGGLIDVSQDVAEQFVIGGRSAFTYHKTDMRWTCTITGSNLSFYSVPDEKKIERFKGLQSPKIYFDEADLASQATFFYLISRNRGGPDGFKNNMTGYVNPGQSWLTPLIEWYINKDGSPIWERCRSGIVRYFAVLPGDTLVQASTKQELIDKYQMSEEAIFSFTYFHTVHTDNIGYTPEQMAEYRGKLHMQTGKHRDSLLFGNWRAGNDDHKYFYRPVIDEIKELGQVCTVDIDRSRKVGLFMDVGMDANAAVAFQDGGVNSPHLVFFEQKAGEYLEDYFHHLGTLADEWKFNYGTIWLPWDVDVKSTFVKGGLLELAKQYARDNGMRDVRVLPKPPNSRVLLQHIELAKKFLRMCKIDAKKCESFLKFIYNYQKKYNETGEVCTGGIHDNNSHAADTLRYIAVWYLSSLNAPDVKCQQNDWRKKTRRLR